MGIVLAAMVACVKIGALAYAEDHSPGPSNSTDVIGKPVKNIDGKNLGKISDLVINWRGGGYIEYVVLSSGGFLGLGDEYFAVPWEALRPSGSKEHFVLSVKQEHLKDVPGSVVYRFYDRSSAAVLRAGRLTAAQSAPAMKGGMQAVSVAPSSGMQYAMEADVPK